MKNLIIILALAPCFLQAQTIILDGTKSFDRDSKALRSYQWEKVSGPDITIDNPKTAMTKAIPKSFGDYVFKLTVTDSAGATSSASWTAHVSKLVVLPVKFQSFSNQQTGTVNKLTWVMSDETGAFSYAVQRSSDQKTFSTLTTIKPTGGKTYSYTDDGKGASIFYYRIAATDQSTTVTYSTTLTVKYTAPPPPVKKCHYFWFIKLWCDK